MYTVEKARVHMERRDRLERYTPKGCWRKGSDVVLHNGALTFSLNSTFRLYYSKEMTKKERNECARNGDVGRRLEDQCTRVGLLYMALLRIELNKNEWIVLSRRGGGGVKDGL